MKGVIYTRVSSDEQVKGMSLDFQRQDCLQYASERKLSVAEIFEERGESAKFADRPQLLKVLDFCKKNNGHVQVLIVWKLDRLSRNQMDYFFIKRTLLSCGVTIHSATEPSLEDSSSIAGKVFEAFSALQAEIDNTMRRDRAVRGMDAKIASGIFPWKPPLGYTCAQNRLRGLKKNSPDEPDLERFPIIRRLFKACLEDRIVSSAALATLANSWGLRGRGGAKIYPQLVDRILANKFYAGLLTNPWTKSEAIGKHEPIISVEDYYKIQYLRSGKAMAASAVRSDEHPDFPLRRTVRCSDCKGPLTGSWSRGNGGRYAYYHCGNKKCSVYGKGIRKLELEKDFCKMLSDVSPRSQTLAVLKQAVVDIWEEDQKSQRDSAQRQAKRRQELEDRIDRLITLKEHDLLTDDEFLKRKTRLRLEISEAGTIVTRIGPDRRAVEQVLDDAGKLIADIPSEWLSMEPKVRKRFEKSILPEGIEYARGKGFGTAKLGLIYELNPSSSGSKTRLVHLVKDNWNQLMQELQLFADIARELRSPAPPEDEPMTWEDIGLLL